MRCRYRSIVPAHRRLCLSKRGAQLLDFLAGRNLASRWRPGWMPAAYMIPLGLALRFFHYALFEGQLLSVHYFITDTAVLIASALLGYRLTIVRQMVNQYPWLFGKCNVVFFLLFVVDIHKN